MTFFIAGFGLKFVDLIHMYDLLRLSEGGYMEKLLVTSDEYTGRYVAMKSFNDNTIVGVGDSLEEALKDAEKKGFKNVVLLYIPEKDLVHIYSTIDSN